MWRIGTRVLARRLRGDPASAPQARAECRASKEGGDEERAERQFFTKYESSNHWPPVSRDGPPEPPQTIILGPVHTAVWR